MPTNMRPLDSRENPTRWVRQIDNDTYEIIEITSDSDRTIDGTRLSRDEINRLSKLSDN